MSLPDIKGREKILRVHMKRTPIDADVNPVVLAKGTPGFSGADLENLVNEVVLDLVDLGQLLEHLGLVFFAFEDSLDPALIALEEAIFGFQPALGVIGSSNSEPSNRARWKLYAILSD